VRASGEGERGAGRERGDGERGGVWGGEARESEREIERERERELERERERGYGGES
jgi:hypothetical protein